MEMEIEKMKSKNKKNKKKKAIIVIIVLLIVALIIGGITYAIINVVKKEEDAKKEREAKEKEIVENFEVFKENALAFGEESVEYRTWIKNDINDSTIYQYDAWILTLDNMNNYVTEMSKVADIYKKNCLGTHYSKADVQEKCDAFMDAYERAVNTFVTDVTDFNEKIKGLREKTKKEELKEYELKFEKVDANNDKQFNEIEMEEVESTESK